MKKWLFSILALIVLLLVAVYVFIPRTLNVVVVAPIQCNVDAAERSLRDTANRAKWWGGADSGGIACRVTGIFRRMVDLTVDDGKISVPSRLTVFPKVRIDSCILQWELSLSSGLNPIGRVESYLEARKLAGELRWKLSGLGSRLEDQRLVYGMVITKGNTTDSSLVSTQQLLDRYPSDSVIYVMAGKLRRYIAQNGAHETSYPMLNVTVESTGAYKVEVGLPTDKELKDAGDIRSKELHRVLFLEADVRGGDATVREAVRQMANYISDYQRTIMAIPYQSLITDRMKETDTTKWLTRLYVPIFPHKEDF